MPIRYARSRFTILAALAVGLASTAFAQELRFPSDAVAEAVIPPTPPNPTATDDINYQALAGAGVLGADEVPFTNNGGGLVYSPSLGAHLRATYQTRSYAQEEGTFSLGTLKTFNLDGGVAFLDGQVTMNDESGVGYNVGAGYRWITPAILPWGLDSEKIAGVSIWSDGQTIGRENFFPQVGVSFEMLGERTDFRANAYIPVGEDTQTRDFVSTGNLSYTQNNVADLLRGVQDAALTSGDIEVAGRLGDLDAWAFAGVYALDGPGVDAVGGKLGLRGYATPDLLLSIALANDEEFDTNALFRATWFIGRTRAENAPIGAITDRFREPVLRNNYVATQQSVAFAAGAPLQDANLQDIRIVHVDSTAAAGGDGTFENPLNSLDAINANSQTGDLVLAHGGSDFDGQTAMLLDDQMFVGEGEGFDLMVTTSLGAVSLPETAPGAMAGARPTIAGPVAGAGVVLADNNVVQNLTFDGGQNAVTTDGALGSLNPTLRDISVAGTTGDAFALNAVVVPDADDIDNDTDVAETTNVLGTVTIEDIAFSNVGGRDIAIDGARAAAEAADLTNATPITINRIDSDNNVGAGPRLAITNTTGVVGDGVMIDDYDYVNDATGEGFLFDNTGGDVLVTNSSLTGGTGPAINAQGNTGMITVGNTNAIANITGNAVQVANNTGVVTVDADITTDAAIAGGTVSVNNSQATVTVSGDITANNVDAVAVLNAQSNVVIGSGGGAGGANTTLTHNGTGAAVRVTDNGAVAATSGQSDGITVNSDIDNNGGNSVVVAGVGGARIDDAVQFAGEITDTGDGIRISNVDPNAVAANPNVEFLDRVNINTTAGASDAVVIAGNAAGANVSFEELDIATSGTARGLVSDGGELNVTGDDGATPSAFTSSITTANGQAIAITGGSSINDVSFGTVTTANPANAVTVSDFDGTVTVDGGTLNASAEALSLTNASLTLGAVTVNSAVPNADRFNFNDGNNHTLTLNGTNLSGDQLRIDQTGAGTVTVNATEVLNASGYDFNLNGVGNLSATVSGVEEAVAIAADATNTSTGDLSLAVSDSGATTALTGLTFNQLGTGSATANFENVTSTSGIGFTSASNTTSMLTVTGGSYGGDIDPQETGSGSLTATLTNVTSTGGVDFDANGGGNGTLTVSGGSFGGPILGSTGNGVGNFDTSVTNGTAFTANGRVALTSENTGRVDYTLTGLNFTAASPGNAIQLTVGAATEMSDVNVSNNNSPGISAGDGSAFQLAVAGGTVNFLLDNNVLNNDSMGSQSAFVTVDNTATLNATVTNNTFNNDEDGATEVEFEIATLTGNPNLNLNLSSNTAVNNGGGPGSGEILVREGAGTVSVFELDETFMNTGMLRNSATVTFDPNDVNQFTPLPTPPATPSP